MPKLTEHKDYHHLPVSLLAAAAPMVAKGLDVSIFDERVDSNLSERMAGVDYFMVSAYTGYQVSKGYAASKWIKENYPGVKVVWGGPHVTAVGEKQFNAGIVDYIVPGDVDDGTHPLPYWLIDVEKYVNPATERFAYVSSYGCIGSCTFCQTRNRRKLTFLPLERVEKDIGYLMSQYPYKEAVFFDSTVFTKQDRALFLSRLMKKHNLKWICDSRADEICRMPKNILDEIMSSGIIQLTVGMETGSPRIADLMNKGKNHLEKYKKCAEILSKYDVKLVSGCIFGCPGEGPEDILQTIEYIKKIQSINKNFRLSTTFYKPLPGTIMSKMCERYGYKEPKTLEEWAIQGEGSHYSYNTWNDAPWIVDKNRYRAIYESFREEYKDIFV